MLKFDPDSHIITIVFIADYQGMVEVLNLPCGYDLTLFSNAMLLAFLSKSLAVNCLNMVSSPFLWCINQHDLNGRF